MISRVINVGQNIPSMKRHCSTYNLLGQIDTHCIVVPPIVSGIFVNKVSCTFNRRFTRILTWKIPLVVMFGGDPHDCLSSVWVNDPLHMWCVSVITCSCLFCLLFLWYDLSLCDLRLLWRCYVIMYKWSSPRKFWWTFIFSFLDKC